PLCALGATSSWTFAGNGNWSVSSNWVGGVPAAGTDAVIAHADGTNRVINYDYGGASIQLNSLTVNNTGVGSEIFSQGGKQITVLSETIGTSGNGYWSLSA